MKTTAALTLALLASVAQATEIVGYFVRQEVQGMNRICYYKTVQGIMTLNKRAAEICPVSHTFYI